MDEATDAADCAADSIKLEAFAGLKGLTLVMATAIEATGAKGLETAVWLPTWEMLAVQVEQTEPL